MRSTLLLSGVLASVVVFPLFAQQAPERAPPAATAPTMTPAPKAITGQWRASKFIGLDVYNEPNEKLGDISEILLDQSGKVTGVIIGVGGFLGMGEREVLITMDKLKFVKKSPARR